MENLKITFNLATNLIAKRFLSIDSILLNAHYETLRENGELSEDVFVNIEDDLENLSKWIEVKNGVVSGSIWYTDENNMLVLQNIPVRKTTSPEEIYDFTGKSIISASKPTPQSGEFKRFDLAFETMDLKSIYFYVRGDKEYIEKLLKKVKYVGKKASIGQGWLAKDKGFEIEVIKEDKSFQLDEYTPSRPLPVASFDVKTKKIAYYRPVAPYHLKKGNVACYMPTTALIEMLDNTLRDPIFTFNVAEDKYIKNFHTNTKFLRDRLENDNNRLKSAEKSKHFFEIDNTNENKDSLFVQQNTNVLCAACGDKINKGIVGNIKQFFSAAFNDFPDLSADRGLCEHCMWSVSDAACKTIDFSLVGDRETIYLYGQNMEVFSETKAENSKAQSMFRRKFIETLNQQSVPFSVNFNTNAGKSNHIGFKGKVTISSAYVVFNYGDTSGGEYIDTELLLSGYQEMVKILTERKDINKTMLLNIDDYKGNILITSAANTLANRELMSKFYLKYNASIRRALHMVVM